MLWAKILLSLGTTIYAVWLILELRHREAIAHVLQPGHGGDEDITDFSFGWKLALGFLLGLPALVILWSFVI